MRSFRDVQKVMREKRGMNMKLLRMTVRFLKFVKLILALVTEL